MGDWTLADVKEENGVMIQVWKRGQYEARVVENPHFPGYLSVHFAYLGRGKPRKERHGSDIAQSVAEALRIAEARLGI